MANTIYLIYIYLLSPVFGLYLAITKLTWKYRKWALIMLVTIYGSILILPEGSGCYQISGEYL